MRNFPFLLFCLFLSCAAPFSPSGGEVDKTPPVLLGTIPKANSVSIPQEDFKISFLFDENITLPSISSIIVSPSTPDIPKFKVKSNLLICSFSQLASNTTYTLYFSEGIKDNNEGNKTNPFSFSFSTGTYLDTQILSFPIGLLLSNKQPSRCLGLLYTSNLTIDSIKTFNHLGFYDSVTQKLYYYNLPNYSDSLTSLVFDDLNKNNSFDLDEPFATQKSLLSNQTEQIVRLHTFPKSSSLNCKKFNRFSFLITSSFPIISDSALLSNLPEKSALERNYLNDSLFCFLNEPVPEFLVVDNDTLCEIISKDSSLTDSLEWIPFNNCHSCNYNLNLLYLGNLPAKTNLYKKDTSQLSKITARIFTFNLADERINSPLFIPSQFDSSKDFSIPRIKIDERLTARLSFEYIHPNDTRTHIIQLFTEKRIVASVLANSSQRVHFRSLPPDTYSIRVLVDYNGDGIWSSGNPFLFIEPEPVKIYDKQINLKANWTIEDIKISLF